MIKNNSKSKVMINSIINKNVLKRVVRK